MEQNLWFRHSVIVLEIQTFPYIQLSDDDRTGALQTGEWLRINGKNWDQIHRVVIFAFIYQGVPNWAETDAVVTICSRTTTY
jgi:tellurite resistance protein TerA